MTSTSIHYKLTYFNGRGLAETSRMLFALHGTEFEDYRIKEDSSGAEFKNMKESLPFGQVPILQISGGTGNDTITLSQSKAIERYLARHFHLLGQTELDSQLIDSVGESIRDARESYFKVREKPEEKQKYFETTLGNYFKYWNRFALNHGGVTGASDNPQHFVKNKLTLADVQFFNFVSTFDDQTAVNNVLNSYSALKNIRDSLNSNANMKKYLASRPNTPW